VDHFCVLDMGSLRFSHDRRSGKLTVFTALDEVIATVDVRGDAVDAEAVFRGLDIALGHAYLIRPELDDSRKRLRVALYNPHTAQVVIGPVYAEGGGPRSVTFAADVPLVLPPGGLAGTVADTGDRMTLADHQLRPLEYSLADLSQAYRRHQLQH
jgi:hypothetical protein